MPEKVPLERCERVRTSRALAELSSVLACQPPGVYDHSVPESWSTPPCRLFSAPRACRYSTDTDIGCYAELVQPDGTRWTGWARYWSGNRPHEDDADAERRGLECDDWVNELFEQEGKTGTASPARG